MRSYISVRIAASAFVEKSHQHGKWTHGKVASASVIMSKSRMVEWRQREQQLQRKNFKYSL